MKKSDDLLEKEKNITSKEEVENVRRLCRMAKDA